MFQETCLAATFFLTNPTGVACIRLLSCVSSLMSLAISYLAKAFFTMLACIRLLSYVSSLMYLATWGLAEALFTVPAFIQFYFCVNSFMFLANGWSAKALIAMLAWIRHLFNCAVNIAEREKENIISGSYLPGSPLQTGLNSFDLHVFRSVPSGIFSLRAFMLVSIIHSEPCSGQSFASPTKLIRLTSLHFLIVSLYGRECNF